MFAASIAHLIIQFKIASVWKAEAVLSIYRKCRLGEWVLLNSKVIEAELRQTPDPQRIKLIQNALEIAVNEAVPVDEFQRRANELVQLGFKVFDAAHLASAEIMKADVFLTTDDRLLRRAIRNQSSLQILTDNPVNWLINLSPMGEAILMKTPMEISEIGYKALIHALGFDGMIRFLTTIRSRSW